MTESLNDQLRTEVRSMLRTAGITQRRTAAELGITEKHLSRLLSGHHPMRLDWADKVAELCERKLRVTSEPVAVNITIVMQQPPTNTSALVGDLHRGQMALSLHGR